MLSEEQRLKRNAYAREWARKNREKVRHSDAAKHQRRRAAALSSMRARYYANREVEIAKRKAYRLADLPKAMCAQARLRAEKRGLPFALTPQDVVIPEKCPLLGIVLRVNEGACGPDSPSLDRIVPSLGYVPGNIQVISHKANTIKNSATLAELESVVAHLRATLPRA